MAKVIDIVDVAREMRDIYRREKIPFEKQLPDLFQKYGVKFGYEVFTLFRKVIYKFYHTIKKERSVSLQHVPPPTLSDESSLSQNIARNSFSEEVYIPALSGNEGAGLAFTLAQIENLGLNPDSY